ncbi:DUF3108 domain-containing protein [Maricaulis salignorans]|uniref:DUF3108 domain-containing protein n=1 Tax=Maricaulis salignorans TaxID=144026 RepID=A0A1G9M504_9PROT|nr:DUF3108 domain-containing protein [Maricaulis salignorans]SDL69223.1 Protein of unknown function [Maricaulis salignorans]
MPALFQVLVAATSLVLAGSAVGEIARESDAAAEPYPGGRVISARYSSSVLIFRVGAISLTARIDPEHYAADTVVEAAGLAALFTDFDIRAEVEGRRTEASVLPLRYAHVERTGSKVRAVDIAFDNRMASAHATPPFGSLGVPPATAEQREGVIDPISAIFLLAQARIGGEAGVCSGSLPVFDGKARYNLRLEAGESQTIRTPAWRGEALLCHAWYEPIAGYDPEDYPTQAELRYPLDIWLAPFPEHGFYLPVRLHTRAGFGGVTIQVAELDIQLASAEP